MIIARQQANQDAIMDIGGWLRSLGLEQYEKAFRENNVDDTVLSSLTAEDLKDLGVDTVGHPSRCCAVRRRRQRHLVTFLRHSLSPLKTRLSAAKSQ
jgi:hypothetical protein